MVKLLLLLVMSLALTAMSHLLEDWKRPVVCTPAAGCMRGRYERSHKYYEAFLGIPYALAPVGDYRFRSPQALPRWQGVYNASKVAPDCIQKNYLLPDKPVSGKEDCLYLNVYRPVFSLGRKLPVMIYIFGGGWFSGSANPAITGPEYFMDTEQVILVTFSYRLGAFGFLATGDEAMPGNFGLKDQLLVMRWVNQNIEYFGGNPEKVTLFGQSVGAVSAHLHMLRPRKEQLFHGVIALSGTANTPFAINEQPREQAVLVADFCGIANAENLTSQQLLEALQKVDANTLLEAGDHLKFWDVDPISNYRPVVEPLNDEDPFLPYHPDMVLNSGDYQPVPFMLGFVPEEGAVRALAILESEELSESFNANFTTILKSFLEFPPHLNEQQVNESMSKIIEEYFQGEEELNNNTRLAFLQLVTERGFHHPLYKTVRAYVNTMDTDSHPIYLYSFNYKGPSSYSALYTGGKAKHEYGVVHCDDLIYLFRSSALFPDFPENSQQQRVSKLFINNFVHFAKLQQPRPMYHLSKCNKTTFQRANDTICDYQLFQSRDNDFRLVYVDNAFNTSRMQFWDEILADRSQERQTVHPKSPQYSLK